MEAHSAYERSLQEAISTRKPQKETSAPLKIPHSQSSNDAFFSQPKVPAVGRGARMSDASADSANRGANGNSATGVAFSVARGKPLKFTEAVLMHDNLSACKSSV